MNKFHGDGTLKWPDGRIYAGPFIDDIMQPEGTITYPNKDRMKGGKGSYYDKDNKKQGKFIGLTADGKDYSVIYKDDRVIEGPVFVYDD